jgi:hypothetical protein
MSTFFGCAHFAKSYVDVVVVVVVVRLLNQLITWYKAIAHE